MGYFFKAKLVASLNILDRPTLLFIAKKWGRGPDMEEYETSWRFLACQKNFHRTADRQTDQPLVLI